MAWGVYSAIRVFTLMDFKGNVLESIHYAKMSQRTMFVLLAGQATRFSKGTVLSSRELHLHIQHRHP